MSETKNVLRLDNITMQFGGVVAVDDLSMEVNEGSSRSSAPTARARPPRSTPSPVCMSRPTAWFPLWASRLSATTRRAR